MPPAINVKKVYEGRSNGFTARVWQDLNVKEGERAFFTNIVHDGEGIVYESPHNYMRRQNARRSVRSEMNKRIKDVAFAQA